MSKDQDSKLSGFFGGVRDEMKKVTWPNRDTLTESIVVTLATCAIFTVFVFGVDNVVAFVLKQIM